MSDVSMSATAAAAAVAAACRRGVLLLVGVNPDMLVKGEIGDLEGVKAGTILMSQRRNAAVDMLKSGTVDGVYTVHPDDQLKVFLLALVLQKDLATAHELLDDIEDTLILGQNVLASTDGTVTTVTHPMTPVSMGVINFELTVRLKGDYDLHGVKQLSLVLPLGYKHVIDVMMEKGVTRVILRLWDDGANPPCDRDLMCSVLGKGHQVMRCEACAPPARQCDMCAIRIPICEACLALPHSCEQCALEWRGVVALEALDTFVARIPVDQIITRVLDHVRVRNPGVVCAGHPSGRVCDRTASKAHEWTVHDTWREFLRKKKGQKEKYPIPPGYDENGGGGERPAGRGGRGGRGGGRPHGGVRGRW